MKTSPMLIGLHTSPFTERARWAFDYKRMPYERVHYRIGIGEEELYALSKQRNVPVLVVGDEVIPDSTAIVDWIEERAPERALLPSDPALAAQVRLLEDVACGVLAPHARHLLIGRLLVSTEATAAHLGGFFARKYGHSEPTETAARTTVRRVLRSLATTLGGRRHFVGDAFTRADLTIAAMLLVLSPPPDELFTFAPAWARLIYEDPLRHDPEAASLLEWRDAIYREHRGGQVNP